MANQEQVASERTVVRNPAMNDPNAGIIVAAGDPIPAGVGIVSNTPNKVDAAANYEDADAADRAQNPRPATTVVAGSALSPEAQADRQRILDRVQENTDAWNQSTRELGAQAASPEDAPAPATATAIAETPAEVETVAPTDMTVAELDDRYGDADGYPRSGNKADKVAFVTENQGA